MILEIIVWIFEFRNQGVHFFLEHWKVDLSAMMPITLCILVCFQNVLEYKELKIMFWIPSIHINLYSYIWATYISIYIIGLSLWYNISKLLLKLWYASFVLSVFSLLLYFLSLMSAIWFQMWSLSQPYLSILLSVHHTHTVLLSEMAI